MPHQLSLRGSGRLSELLRGTLKANLIHHLAHTGGEKLLRRVGRAYKPSFDWLPDELPTSALCLRGLERTCATSTLDLDSAHPGLADLRKAARLSPRDPWPRVGLGLAHLRLWQGGESFAEAERAFSEAIALRPAWGWGYLLRGEARRSKLDYDGALSDYDEAIRLMPGLSWGPAFKARVLFQRETRGEDMALMDAAIALEKDGGWLYAWRAEGHRRLGALEAAEADFARALALDPLYDQAYYWRARLWEAQGRPEEALASLRAGIALCPEFEKAHRLEVRVLRGLGRTGEALAALERATSLNHRNNWLGLWRVEGMPADESSEAALAALDAFLAAKPKDARARAWRGETLCQLGRLEEGLTALDAALADKSAPAWARAWRGECLLRLGRLPEARRELARDAAADPSYGRTFVWLGRAKALSGDWKGAIAAFDRAMAARRVEYAWIQGWRGEAKLRLGRFEEALADLDAAVALDGGCADFQRWRAEAQARALLARLAPLKKSRAWARLVTYRLLRELGLPGALRELDLAFRKDPDCAWALGLGEPPAEHAAEAAPLLEAGRAFAESPACGPVYAYRGWARAKAGRLEEGLSDLERAALLEPAGWVLAWLGKAQARAGRRDEARASYAEALRLDPSYANALAWRAELHLSAGDGLSALKDLDAALARYGRLRPASPGARLQEARSRAGRARALSLLGEEKAAREELERAAALDWELAVPAWAERAQNSLAAGDLAAAREALAALPRGRRASTRGLWLSAELDLRRGRAAAAAASLAKAARLSPHSARLALAQARAAAASGDEAGASRQLARSLALCPDSPEALAFKTEREGPPKILEFFVNYACNAKCPFCFNPPDASPELERGLELPELARRMAAGWAEGYRAIKFIGGEVTIRDDFPKILGVARKVGFRSVQVTTNGIRLADPAFARMTARLGVDSVRISVHGASAETHDALVRVPGALEKVKKAAANVRALGLSLGINHVISRPNVDTLAETLLFYYRELGAQDVILYFLRYQGFGALPENKALLSLRMSEAAPRVREGFRALRAAGYQRMPTLIHMPPCVLPELSGHMLDWTKEPGDCGQGNTPADRLTLPDGSGGLIHDWTNDGKAQVPACASCSLSRRCLGVESRYVALFGDGEFKPLGAEVMAAA